MANLSNVSNLNLLTSPRWIAMIPYTVVDPGMGSKNFSMNLCEFELNENTTGQADVGFLGYQIPLPVAVRTVNKSMTFSYLMDSALSQYKFLYQWFSKIVTEEGSGFEPKTNTLDPAIYEGLTATIRVIILSEYKNPVLELIYDDCWIQALGKVSFSYMDQGAPVIKSNFTIKYGKLSFNWEPQPLS